MAWHVTNGATSYVYPSTLRTRMSETWGVDVTHWWLPYDEGYPPVVRAIREFIEYRARVPADDMSAHVRDMSGIFRSLDLGGGYGGSQGGTPVEERGDPMGGMGGVERSPPLGRQQQRWTP